MVCHRKCADSQQGAGIYSGGSQGAQQPGKRATPTSSVENTLTPLFRTMSAGSSTAGGRSCRRRSCGFQHRVKRTLSNTCHSSCCAGSSTAGGRSCGRSSCGFQHRVKRTLSNTCHSSCCAGSSTAGGRGCGRRSWGCGRPSPATPPPGGAPARSPPPWPGDNS
jgi:hypothetical protein